MKKHWRQIPSEPIEPEAFCRALDLIARNFGRVAGKLAPALGGTRLLVPLTLFLRQEYAQVQIVSILLRLQALQILVRDGALEAWIVGRSEDGLLVEIHAAAAEAAASLPLDDRDRFPVGVFLARVEALAASQNADDDRTVQIPAL